MARITSDRSVVISVNPKTASGNPASIDGNAVFGQSTRLGTFEQLSPTSARFTPTGDLGVTQITATVDADLDEGEVRTLEASGALEIVAPEAETLELQFTPE